MWEPVWRDLGDAGRGRGKYAAHPAGHDADAGAAATPLEASETATLDALSGAAILAVDWARRNGFANFGEVTERKTRAELLDEGLDIITGLWQASPSTTQGHYRERDAFLAAALARAAAAHPHLAVEGGREGNDARVPC